MAPEAASSSIADVNDPQLTSEIQHPDPTADAYAPSKLQHGLTHDDQGRLCVKPEIAVKLAPRVLARADALLYAERTSEANSLVACRHVHNVTSFCAEGHEAECGPVLCGKPLLHEECATPKARVSKFIHEHPELYAHISENRFQVFTLTVPQQSVRTPEQLRSDIAIGRTAFKKFTRKFNGGHRGWYWLAGFSENLRDTKMYAIHIGSTLPQQPTLLAMWRKAAGPNADLRLRTFDGRDGDTQKVGLELAHSGFVNYWMYVLKMDDDLELRVSEAFRDEDLSALYGRFRGFAPQASTAITEPFTPTCSICGRLHIRQHMLGTIEELSQRFDHIRPVSYGEKERRIRRMSLIAASPPS